MMQKRPDARSSARAGFTLVELAIVLTIVGLLIAGVLEGQQLIQNQRVTSTIALAWPVGDPAFASLDAKREAMAEYAAQYL